jgi:hypothetical protein
MANKTTPSNRFLASKPIIVPKDATAAEREKLRFPVVPRPKPLNRLKQRLFGRRKKGATAPLPARKVHPSADKLPGSNPPSKR